MTKPWAELVIPTTDFDVAALAAALDAQRLARGLTWAGMMRQMNRTETALPRETSASTVRGLATRRFGVEGDGVLTMLGWLGRTPESFVPGHPGADHPDAQLPTPPPAPGLLRFDVAALYGAVDAKRVALGLTWREAAAQMGSFFITAQHLQGLTKGGRVGFPHVMQVTRWVGAPAARFIRPSRW